jgi:hypothetical protein
MSPEIFHALHDLLVSTYGLNSTNNVLSIESLTVFLWIVGGPESFAQAENHFTWSLWTVHTKFHEVLKCLCNLAKDNVTPRDPTFSTEHERLREDRFWPTLQRCNWSNRWFTNSSGSAIGRNNQPHMSLWIYILECAICDFDMSLSFRLLVG